VEFFSAVKPDTAGAFPSVGARGCFLSHLGILRQALQEEHRTFMILEDDAAFSEVFRTGYAAILDPLRDGAGDWDGNWAIAYPGHQIPKMPGPEAARTEHWRVLPAETGVRTTHAMILHHRVVAPLIDYFEQMAARPAGHHAGGPMHVDGAYSWFRRDHPDLVTLVTPRSYILQRPSHSDIAPPTWKDRLPFVRILRRIKSRLKSNT
jgi:hypothetical protein